MKNKYLIFIMYLYQFWVFFSIHIPVFSQCIQLFFIRKLYLIVPKKQKEKLNKP